jgi:CHC2 zinc finger
MIDLAPIRARADLVTIASSYGVQLRKAAAQWTGPCPFHHPAGTREKSASFYIHPGKQVYKCWSCGESGDVFRFVQQIERIDFRAAVRRVAELCGYPLENEAPLTPEERSEQARIREAARKVAREAAIWRRLRLADLERAKETAFGGRRARWDRLAAPAREHCRLQAMGPDALIEEYLRVRSRAVVQRIRRFEMYTARIAALMVGAMAEKV